MIIAPALVAHDGMLAKLETYCFYTVAVLKWAISNLRRSEALNLWLPLMILHGWMLPMHVAFRLLDENTCCCKYMLMLSGSLHLYLRTRPVTKSVCIHALTGDRLHAATSEALQIVQCVRLL